MVPVLDSYWKAVTLFFDQFLRGMNITTRVFTNTQRVDTAMASIKQKQNASTRESKIKETLPISNHLHIRTEHEVRDVAEKFEACDNPILVCKKFIRDRYQQFRGVRESTRVYHIWPGKNVFFLGGRLVCGPDPKGLILTTLSILLSSWIFCVYVGNDLQKNSDIKVASALVLTVIVLVNLILVSAIDPGIIPRSDKIAEDRDEGLRSKKVVIDGVEVKLKLCRICKILRPPRSCHCAICDNCVDKFDHHCPWTGQCIGLRNYRFYLMFVLSALFFFVYVFSFTCRRINQRMSDMRTGLFTTVGNCPETLALATFSFVAMLFLGGLASFHIYLVMMNQTAYENYRQCYAESPNPYDKGILRNVQEVLFTRFPSSLVNFPAEMPLKTDPGQGDQGCLLTRVNAIKAVDGKQLDLESRTRN